MPWTFMMFSGDPHGLYSVGVLFSQASACLSWETFPEPGSNILDISSDELYSFFQRIGSNGLDH